MYNAVALSTFMLGDNHYCPSPLYGLSHFFLDYEVGMTEFGREVKNGTLDIHLRWNSMSSTEQL